MDHTFKTCRFVGEDGTRSIADLQMIRKTVLAAVRLGAARAGKGFLLPVPLVGAYVIDGPGKQMSALDIKVP